MGAVFFSSWFGLQTLEHFFAMDLPVSLDLFSSLTRGLDGVLVAYFSRLMKDVGEFGPLAPGLTVTL